MRLLILVICLSIGFAAAASAAPRPRAQTMAGPVAGSVIAVLDGDTITVRVNVWIGQELVTDVRIRGIDTPEMRSACAAERKLAETARNEVQRMVSAGTVTLSDIRLEKYAGRVLATVHSGKVSVAEHLMAQGLARPYGGEKRQNWCDSNGRLQATAISSGRG